ncbi:MAG TPA: carbon storage regulator CsrA [Planctomycetaceae bacterium]|jgi:carbon storage regulator|nr:carbon storage regulator CsrA [Planctomycetaceae bacterium]
MLVLSRKKDERIVIGDNVSICVMEIRGDKVRLGIEAPQEVSVHRQEVYDAIKAEERASTAAPDLSTAADAAGGIEDGK